LTEQSGVLSQITLAAGSSMHEGNGGGASGSEAELQRRHSWDGRLHAPDHELPLVLQPRHRLAAAALVRHTAHYMPLHWIA